ncbi:MAG: hypothetical protein Q7S10_02110 [bacterium]|nr:hypothetical protein [bacterium]
MDQNNANLFIIFLLVIIATVLMANYFSDISISSAFSKSKFSASLTGSGDLPLSLVSTNDAAIPGLSEELDLSQTETVAASLALCSCGVVASSGLLCFHAYKVLPWPSAQTCLQFAAALVPTTGTCNDLNGTNFISGPFGFEEGRFLPTHGTFTNCLAEVEI